MPSGPQHEELSGITAREYRKRYPNKPTLALARIMYNENSLLYTNVETARTALRRIEGKLGSKKRSELLDKSMLAGERPRNPYSLPESDEIVYEPYILKGYKRPAIFCDLHAPYYNMAAVTTAISFCKNEKVDCLIANGDWFDFHTISRFQKDPSKKKFGEELDIGCRVFELLQDELGCDIVYKLGNHCIRYKHYLQQKAGEIEDLPDLAFEQLIANRVDGIKIIPDKTIIKANDLNIVHGHEFGNSVFSPVSAARGLYMRAKANTICGHYHRVSENTEMTIEGKIITTWSVGALCELHPDFLPINNWSHGFCIVELDENGKDFEVRNKRIWKGKIL